MHPHLPAIPIQSLKDHHIPVLAFLSWHLSLPPPVHSPGHSPDFFADCITYVLPRSEGIIANSGKSTTCDIAFKSLQDFSPHFRPFSGSRRVPSLHYRQRLEPFPILPVFPISCKSLLQSSLDPPVSARAGAFVLSSPFSGSPAFAAVLRFPPIFSGSSGSFDSRLVTTIFAFSPPVRQVCALQGCRPAKNTQSSHLLFRFSPRHPVHPSPSTLYSVIVPVLNNFSS